MHPAATAEPRWREQDAHHPRNTRVSRRERPPVATRVTTLGGHAPGGDQIRPSRTEDARSARFARGRPPSAVRRPPSAAGASRPPRRPHSRATATPRARSARGRPPSAVRCPPRVHRGRGGRIRGPRRRHALASLAAVRSPPSATGASRPPRRPHSRATATPRARSARGLAAVRTPPSAYRRGCIEATPAAAFAGHGDATRSLRSRAHGRPHPAVHLPRCAHAAKSPRCEGERSGRGSGEVTPLRRGALRPRTRRSHPAAKGSAPASAR